MVSLITWAARELRAKTVSLFPEVKAGQLVCPSVRSFIFLFMLPSSPSKVLVAVLPNKTCWSQDQFSIVSNLDNEHPESVHPIVFTLWPKAPKSAAWSARFALVCFQCSFKILPCHLFSFSACEAGLIFMTLHRTPHQVVKRNASGSLCQARFCWVRWFSKEILWASHSLFLRSSSLRAYLFPFFFLALLSFYCTHMSLSSCASHFTYLSLSFFFPFFFSSIKEGPKKKKSYND